jgi:hypothetical protein
VLKLYNDSAVSQSFFSGIEKLFKSMDKNGDGLVTKQVGFSCHTLSCPMFRILFRILFRMRMDLLWLGSPESHPEAMKWA